MIRRKWLVVRTVNMQLEILERCWTERGAWRSRDYWWTLQRAVGNRCPLNVIREP